MNKDKKIKAAVIKDFNGDFFDYKVGEKITLEKGEKTKFAVVTPFGNEDIDRRYINVLTGKVKLSYSVLVGGENGDIEAGQFIGDQETASKFLEENKHIFNIKNLTEDLKTL